MRTWLLLSRAIDRLNVAIGRFVGWLTLAMVLIGAYNAVVRYLGGYLGRNLSSNAYLELQWYLFSMVFLLGASYTYRQGAHVRVDLIYGRLAERGRAWIDLVGTLVLMLPFTVFALWLSWPSVRNSWAVREVSPDPGGLARYPIKSVILLAFGLLVLQGISQAIKQVGILRGAREPRTEGEEHREIRL